MEEWLAGAAGGAAGLLAGHPLDTLKTRLQASDSTRYASSLSCALGMLKEEGLGSVYKGLRAPLLASAGINALVFGVRGWGVRMADWLGVSGNTLLVETVCGASAGFAQSFIACPVELVKTRLQMQGEGLPDRGVFSTRSSADIYRGPLDCARKIVRAQGLRGLFRGLGPTILRDAPGYAAYFLTYEWLRLGVLGSPEAGAAGILMAGGCAGVISWLLFFPADVVKSRLQADGVLSPRLPPRYSSAWQCSRELWRRERLRGFVRGLGPTLLRAFTVNAVTFAAFEALASLLFKAKPLPTQSESESEHPCRDPSCLYNSTTALLIAP